MNPSVRIEGLKELRKDAKKAGKEANRALTNALKKGAESVPPAMRRFAPERKGALAAGIGKPTASGSRVTIAAKAGHSAIIEFAKKGRLGATLTARYGAAPRFGYRALDDQADQVVEVTERELEPILTAYGWFKYGRVG